MQRPIMWKIAIVEFCTIRLGLDAYSSECSPRRLVPSLVIPAVDLLNRVLEQGREHREAIFGPAG